MNTIILLLAIVVFCLGMSFYINNTSIEGLTTMDGEMRCPNILIQKGPKYYLYNSNVAQVPGVNPIEFNNLEEYTEFLEWQRGAGIRCPVLYVQILMMFRVIVFIKCAQVLLKHKVDYLLQHHYHYQ